MNEVQYNSLDDLLTFRPQIKEFWRGPSTEFGTGGENNRGINRSKDHKSRKKGHTSSLDSQGRVTFS